MTKLTTANQVIHGDAVEIIKWMPDNSVDLIFGSPPYGKQRKYGELDFSLTGQDYVDWVIEWYVECVRVSRGLVAMVIEGSTRKFDYDATPFLIVADLKRRGIKLRKPPAFHRVGIPGSGGPDWLRNDWEPIICASSGRLPWSDNTACGHPPKYAKGGEPSHHGVDGRVSAVYKPPKLSNPGNVIQQTYTAAEVTALLDSHSNVKKYSVGGGVMGSPLAHENEAPFPQKLAEFFIKSFCPVGGVVLDPFSGSGTTAAASVALYRQYTAIDARKSQCELTRRRVAEAEAEMVPV